MALLMLTSCQSVPGSPGEPRQKTAAEWQAMARADLDATHALILSSHPGAIDELNPTFLQWTEEGYRQAQQLIPRVVSYDTALAAVRFYVTGFRDGHFGYSDNVRNGYPIITSGWKVEEADGNYVVSATLTNWPVALPPTGARLIECDGRTPAAIVDEDVAPYFDRRTLPSVRNALASGIGQLYLSGAELKRCQFAIGAGKLVDYELVYRAASQDDVSGMRASPMHTPDRSNRFSVADGVLWIRAYNFQLQPGTTQAEELDTMLKELPRLQGVRRIVFDARGNSGGDSGVGHRIFNAATGGLEFDQKDIERHPRTYAEWRVSDLAIAKMIAHVDEATLLYGTQSNQVAWSAGLLDQLVRAKAEGRSWIEQGDGAFRLTRDDIAARNGKLRNFSGTVAIMTDANCASACLDFADLIRRVPGSVHMGQASSADTVYMDVGHVKLPSGNLLFIPAKVWRNRFRGNNEVLTPDIPLHVNMNDDAAVYAAALAALKVHRQQ
jgi:hypothetical protein